MQTTLRMSRARYEQALGTIKNLPAVLTGKSGNAHMLYTLFWNAFAYSFFKSVSTAFLAKAYGTSDELGNLWKPVSLATLARRPFSKQERLKFQIGPYAGRGLLSSAENKLWNGIFAGQLKRLSKKGLNEFEAKQMAARIAWSILKARGARTRLSLASQRDPVIMLVTKRLYQSLLPTSQNTAPAGGDTIFQGGAGWIELGTAVPYATQVTKDRPIFPRDVSLWIDRAVGLGLQQVISHLGMIL